MVYNISVRCIMELKQITDKKQWKRIKALYKAAFPKYERKPFRLIRSMHKKGTADVWYIEDNGRFTGLAATMNHGDLVLLDYFAIAEDCRGQGAGSRALQMLQQHYSGRRFFLEIESVYTEAENLPERIRRKQFYLKNGMTEMRIYAKVGVTEMEVLGYNCTITFPEYQSVYLNNLGMWAKKYLVPLDYPEK